MTEEDITAKDPMVLTKNLFDASYQKYVTKNQAMLEKAKPILTDVHAKRGGNGERNHGPDNGWIEANRRSRQFGIHHSKPGERVN